MEEKKLRNLFLCRFPKLLTFYLLCEFQCCLANVSSLVDQKISVRLSATLRMLTSAEGILDVR